MSHATMEIRSIYFGSILGSWLAATALTIPADAQQKRPVENDNGLDHGTQL
jgi:hypothetical protein